VSVNLQRVAALAAVYFAAELLERIAYRAGVTDGAAAADAVLADLDRAREEAAEDLEAFDATEVLEFHGYVAR
jgi:hypothetical protein